MTNDNWLEDVNYSGPLFEIGHAEGHHCYLYREPNGGFRARCTCEATWTYGKEATLEYMQSIYHSHVKYFNRPKMETL